MGKREYKLCSRVKIVKYDINYDYIMYMYFRIWIFGAN